MNISKNTIVIIIVVILIVVGVAFWHKKINDENGYSVVYLSTGEVYIGKLSIFPNMTLTDAYLLQATKDANGQSQTSFQINPIKEAVWAPKSLHLIKENVIFYGPLSPDSKIAATLAAQNK